MLDAVWITKHSDRPVVVVRLLGTGPDGRNYVSIKDSTTGVPLDELVFMDFDGNYTSGVSVYSDPQGRLHLTE